MTLRTWLPAAAFVGVGILTVGCGTGLKTVRPAVTPPPAPVAVIPQAIPAPVADPVADLIAESERHFAAGEKELGLGHLEQAKAAFDVAVEVLLKSSYGATSEPRIRQHFGRLVDRISAHEINSLAKGDGFVEKKAEPASIDELLAISTFEPPAASAELKNTVESDLSTTRHDVPIPLNRKVLSYIELFQSSLREFIDDGLRRASRYLPMIEKEFLAQGVPLDLAYIPLIESSFKNTAQSRVKAKGMWQFMKPTGLEHGLRLNWYVDERSDPEKATRAAAQYLKTLGRMFKGDWHLAMASYNGGPGRVQRAIARSRRTNFWDLSATTRYLPRETREYVPMILAAIVIAKNPAQYGFDYQPQLPLAYERVTVSEPIDLRRVAEWTGAAIDDIEDLNPELRRWTTPVRYDRYDIKVPVGTGDLFRARLAESSPEGLSALQWHTVKSGESLVTIARKLGVNRADLAEANYLSIRSRVAPGQRLIIPRAPATLFARTEDRVPEAVVAEAKVAEPRPAATRAAALADSPAVSRPDPQKLVHRVKRGDTLFSIARLYNTTVQALKDWNARLIDGNRIRVGDRLTIFATRLAN